jgi:hypothetical protein
MKDIVGFLRGIWLGLAPISRLERIARICSDVSLQHQSGRFREGSADCFSIISVLDEQVSRSKERPRYFLRFEKGLF